MPVKLITHDRVFHADDVVAAAILRMVYPTCEVVRTRDPEILKVAAEEPETFLLDVGGVYDPAKGLYDHHQRQGAGFRNMEALEWPYATAGLVWLNHGVDAILAVQPELSREGALEVQDHIDEYFIKQIDAVDCGVRLHSSGPTVSAIIAAFNPSWADKDEEYPFELVVNLAQVILQNFIRRDAGKVLAREQVRRANADLDGRVLVLDNCMPWTEVVALERPDVLLCLYPTGPAEKRQWQVRCAADTNRELRISLPEAWGGLERGAFVQATGERDAVFCHRGLYLAAASSLEGAMNLARAALKVHFENAVPALIAA